MPRTSLRVRRTRKTRRKMRMVLKFEKALDEAMEAGRCRNRSSNLFEIAAAVDIGRDAAELV